MFWPCPSTPSHTPNKTPIQCLQRDGIGVCSVAYKPVGDFLLEQYRGTEQAEESGPLFPEWIINLPHIQSIFSSPWFYAHIDFSGVIAESQCYKKRIRPIRYKKWYNTELSVYKKCRLETLEGWCLLFSTEQILSRNWPWKLPHPALPVCLKLYLVLSLLEKRGTPVSCWPSPWPLSWWSIRANSFLVLNTEQISHIFD